VILNISLLSKLPTIKKKEKEGLNLGFPDPLPLPLPLPSGPSNPDPTPLTVTLPTPDPVPLQSPTSQRTQTLPNTQENVEEVLVDSAPADPAQQELDVLKSKIAASNAEFTLKVKNLFLLFSKDESIMNILKQKYPLEIKNLIEAAKSTQKNISD